MLQQIIKEMYIEPDLLAELSDEQKQLIYIKIREEQVRRWTEFELNNGADVKPAHPSKCTDKGVQFVLGEDANPWVWVMGEHANDRSIDEIIEEEAQAKASLKAETEAGEIRKREEIEADINLKQEEGRLEVERLERERALAAAAAAQRKEAENAQKLAQTQREADRAKREIAKLKEKSEQARLTREESYRVLKEKRTSEIMGVFHKTKALWEQKAAEDGKHLDQAWKQQERKAKQAESNLKRLVRGAREDYRRNSVRQQDGVTRRTPRMSREVFRESAVLVSNAVTAVSPSKSPIDTKPRPSSKEDIVSWFREHEKSKKTGLNKCGAVEAWFHGMISRDESENLLSEKPVHSYLVRISEKIWGYAISYKAEDRFKHYLVDTIENGYQFFGTNQLEHSSLNQLIHHHKNHPISTAGQELLIFPVGQSKTPPDYANLFPELIEITSL